MSADILGTSWDQCRSMVQYSFMSTETRRLVRTDSPGRPPRLSHSSWTMCVSHYGSPILDLHPIQAKQCCFSFCFVLTLLVWQRNLPFFFYHFVFCHSGLPHSCCFLLAALERGIRNTHSVNELSFPVLEQSKRQTGQRTRRVKLGSFLRKRDIDFPCVPCCRVPSFLCFVGFNRCDYPHYSRISVCVLTVVEHEKWKVRWFVGWW